ncbi:hypothetical protein [Brenneria goodwinii]|uniref:hypothetical protein n=1 Tax=Brenneria goodwinii TaxID=1109412 RepID=UPI000B0E3C66|nr:hypothetical protein [Brenneria goodwinii]
MEITAQIAADFRVYYPEFSDETTWPDSGVIIALEEGDESTSFAVPSVTMDDLTINGDLPRTAYSVKFMRLRRRAGTGGLKI